MQLCLDSGVRRDKKSETARPRVVDKDKSLYTISYDPRVVLLFN